MFLFFRVSTGAVAGIPTPLQSGEEVQRSLRASCSPDSRHAQSLFTKKGSKVDRAQPDEIAPGSLDVRRDLLDSKGS